MYRSDYERFHVHLGLFLSLGVLIGEAIGLSIKKDK